MVEKIKTDVGEDILMVSLWNFDLRFYFLPLNNPRKISFVSVT